MAYSGTGAPPGAITYVRPGDSAATIQSKMDSVQSGNSLVFVGGSYDFGGTTIVGKSGVTVWADGKATIDNAPGAGTHGAFDFSGDTGWTIGGKAPGAGFVFNGGLIDATNAGGGWAVGNCQFNNQVSNAWDGSAIRMNGASSGTIINNDFTGVGGNVLGMYDLTDITIDGNHFTNCYEPIAIQEALSTDPSLGRDIVIVRNVFIGTERAAIEIGPASSGSEYFSGLIIDNNYFDRFNNTAGPGTLLAISAVGQSAQNTTITNNFIRRGPADAGEVGVAIEMTGSGIVSGNTIVNFSYAALTYQSGWNVYDNTVYNDGSSPYFGFANNGSGTGIFGPETVQSVAPATPAMPSRAAWGGSIVSGGSTPIVTESLAKDSGRSSSDEVTSSATLKGTADANATVSFEIDGVTVASTAKAGASGAWSFTPTGLSDGVHTIVASETNASGMTGSSSLTFTLDTKAPAPVIKGATFASGTVNLIGTSEAGSSVAVYDGKTLVGTATATSAGNWKLSAPADAAVAHSFGATATDVAGNTGKTAIDFRTGPPTAPVLTEGLASDTGTSASDRISSSAALSGTADPRAVVHFVIDGRSLASTATASASGVWSFTPTGLADGAHTVVASTTSAGGITKSTSLSFTLDTKAPVPAVTGATFAAGNVTLKGTSEAGSKVSVYEGLGLIGTAIADSAGKWTMTGAGDANAFHAYGAVATDLAGNSGQSAMDYRPLPSLTARLARDTGTSRSDGVTSRAALSGTADPGAVVQFTVDGQSMAQAATAGASGAWSLTPTGLADGVHTIVASVTNASGMTSSSSLGFTLDTKAPAPVIKGATFASGTVNLVGTSEAGSSVAVYDGKMLVGTATATSAGNWKLSTAADAAVSHSFGATATDAAGNVGKTAIDHTTHGGKAPVVTERLASDTGLSGSDRVTSSAALLGTADPGAVVHFVVDGKSMVQSATASASGAWSFTPTGLADGVHTIVASETSAGGKSGSSSLTFTLDTKAPLPEVTGATFAAGDVTLKGTSEAGSKVSVYEGLSLIGTATADSSGKWTMIGVGDAKVSHFYGAVATDMAGNIGESTSDHAPASGSTLAMSQAGLAGTGEAAMGAAVLDGPRPTLLGSSDADRLAGTAAPDVIAGGAGGDTLTGGGGANSFVYNRVSDSAPAIPDRITDFHHGIDKIDFSNIAGIAAFDGKLAAAGEVTLAAHSVAFLEHGGKTQILVNTGGSAETVSATDAHAADMKIVLVGVNPGLAANDFHCV